MPMVVMMAVLSDEIIIVALGEQWAQAGIIFRILAVAAYSQIFTQTTGWIFISLGQTGRMLRVAYITVPMIILSFMIGLQWGILGVAISYTICNYIITIPLLMYTFKESPITIKDFILAIRKPLIMSLIMAIVMTFFYYYLYNYNLIIKTSITFISGFIMMIFGYLIIPNTQFDVKKFNELLSIVKKKNLFKNL